MIGEVSYRLKEIGKVWEEEEVEGRYERIKGEGMGGKDRGKVWEWKNRSVSCRPTVFPQLPLPSHAFVYLNGGEGMEGSRKEWRGVIEVEGSDGGDADGRE